MNFFKSADVKVYPCGFRGYDANNKMFNPKARMTTEEGLIGLGGAGDLRSSYVISYSNESYGTLDAVIGGYRFKISNITGYTGVNWLCISVGEKTSTSDKDGREKLSRLLDLSSTNSSDEFLDRILNKDKEYYFYGLGYASTTDDLPANCIRLHALDSKGTVPAEAYLPKLLDNGAIKSVITTEDTEKSDNAGGAFSLAIGNGAMAKAAYGAAIGENVSTNENISGQTVVGKYSDDTNAMFAVGDGDSATKRNSFETGGDDGTKINEALTVFGTTTLEDELSVAKDATLQSALSVAGAANVAGAASLANTLSVAETAIFSKDVKIGEYKNEEGNETSEICYKTKIAASGDVVLDGIAAFKSNSIELLQPTTVKSTLSISNDELKVESDVTTSKTKLKAKDIDVTGEANLGHGAVCISPKDNAAAKLTVDVKTTFNKEIEASGQTLSIKSIEASEELKSAGSLKIYEGTNNLLTATAEGVTTDKNITAGGSVSCSSIEASETVNVDGAISCSSLKTTTGDIEVTSGSIKAESGEVSAEMLTASSSITVGTSALTVQAGDETAPATVNIGATTKIDDSLTVTGTVTASDFILESGKQISSVVNKLNGIESSFTTKTLTVNEKIKASKIETSEDVLMTGKNAKINMAGDNSSIEAKRLTISSTAKNAVVIGSSATGTGTTMGENLVTVYGGITANRYNATSDRRLKENLREYKPKRSILELPIYEYDYIHGGKDVIGCMAQDLQEICPEIVSEGSDGYLSIEESKIVYLLLQEVKRLREEVDELKRR